MIDRTLNNKPGRQPTRHPIRDLPDAAPVTQEQWDKTRDVLMRQADAQQVELQRASSLIQNITTSQQFINNITNLSTTQVQNITNLLQQITNVTNTTNVTNVTEIVQQLITNIQNITNNITNITNVLGVTAVIADSRNLIGRPNYAGNPGSEAQYAADEVILKNDAGEVVLVRFVAGLVLNMFDEGANGIDHPQPATPFRHYYVWLYADGNGSNLTLVATKNVPPIPPANVLAGSLPFKAFIGHVRWFINNDGGAQIWPFYQHDRKFWTSYYSIIQDGSEPGSGGVTWKKLAQYTNNISSTFGPSPSAANALVRFNEIVPPVARGWRGLWGGVPPTTGFFRLGPVVPINVAPNELNSPAAGYDSVLGYVEHWINSPNFQLFQIDLPITNSDVFWIRTNINRTWFNVTGYNI